ncbi:MAG TPA: NAD(P)H-dependent oxidoreductase subunit E [Chthonomonadaceae bacterium]|nr:NAD(P)H-dependent oxidoreductase subunit E [Chthonomonadaceae bacterium]
MSTSPMNPISGGGREPLPAPAKERRFSDQAKAELEEIASHYPERKAACLPALWIAQREYGGYLTPAAIEEVADALGLSFAEVEGVATFYTMYNLRPRGRHHLEVCTCLSCAVMGAYDVVHLLEHELGVGLGQTTADGEFTLSEAECLDFCGAATVVQVGDRYFTNITTENVMGLIDELRQSPNYTPAKLADAIVKILIPNTSETGGGSYTAEDLKLPAGPML